MQWFMRWHVHAHAAAGPPSLCPRSTHASGGVAACSLGGGPRAVAGGRLCVERRVLSAQLRAQRGGARARRGARGGRAGRAERRRRGGRRHQGGCVRACRAEALAGRARAERGAQQQAAAAQDRHTKHPLRLRAGAPPSSPQSQPRCPPKQRAQSRLGQRARKLQAHGAVHAAAAGSRLGARRRWPALVVQWC